MKKILCLTVLLCFSSYLLADPLYPLDNVKQEAQFQGLLKELRCLVCQNQDLADSNADLAKDLKLQVYQMVKMGQSDQEILSYLRDRYGEFILFKPPLTGLTWLLWIGPFLFLVLGLLIVGFSVKKRELYE